MDAFLRLIGYILSGLAFLLIVNTVIQPFALYYAENQPLWLALLAAPACLISGALLMLLSTRLIEGHHDARTAAGEFIGRSLLWLTFALITIGGLAIVVAAFMSPVAPIGIVLFGLWLTAVKATWAYCRDG